jgi:hypothetical protein
MNFIEVILKHYPNKRFAVGDTYESLEWYEKEHPKPTYEELKEKWDEMKDEYELNLFRIERDKLLKESDVYALPDFPHKTQEIKEEWFNYRQALRNSTNDMILPSKPF